MVFVLAIIGCGQRYTGPETYYVEGIVTLDGEPLESAAIQLIPVREGIGEAATGWSDEKGKYMLSSVQGLPNKGAMAGEYKVIITAAEKYLLPKPYHNEAGELITHGYRPRTSKIYADIATTPITASVSKGRNDIPFELKSKP